MAPADALLQRIAASTEGFAGADLQALCTAAVMAAVTRSCPHLVDQLCHTATTGLHPDPVSQSCWKPDHHHQQQQQQQPGVQQQRQQQQQPENQKQEQQQPDKQQEALQAKQQDKQQETLQQQQQQQQQGACGQQQQSDRRQQHSQQQHQQPQDGDDGADRMHCGDQVMQAAHQNQHQQQDRGNALQRRDLSPQANQQKQHHTDEASEKLDKKLLTKLRVKAVDWRTALAAAPLPCSARQSLSALSSGHAKALPHHLVPLLLPCISRACQCIAAAQLPWEGTTATALEACAAAAGTPRGAAAAVADEAEAEVATTDTFERVLAELGAVEGPTSGQAGKS